MMIRVVSFLFIVVVGFYACNNEGRTKNFTNEVADSVDYYTECMQRDSTNYKLWGDRAKLYLKKGNLDASLRDLQYALKLAPNQPELFLILSDVYFVLGQADNGISSLKKVVQLDDKNVDAYLKLSEVYLLMDNPKVAERYANEALNVDRRNAESFYVLAMAQMANRDTASAILNFGISANLDTASYMSYMQLGAIYNSRGDSVSKDYFEKALEVVPNDESAAYFLGMYYQEKSDFLNAIKYFDIVNIANPENRRAYYNKGYIYLVELGDPNKAIDMFEIAVGLNPLYVEAVYNLGRSYEELKDYDNARVQYRRAIEILPNYPLAVQGLNRLDDIQIRGKMPK